MLNWPLTFIIIGRILLASYFLKAGINNIFSFSKLLGLLKTKKIPFPSFVLAGVITIEIIGSIAIIFNIQAFLASIALILFTLALNLLICNYWTMEGPQRRSASFLFYANIAVIGALFLVTGLSGGG